MSTTNINVIDIHSITTPRDLKTRFPAGNAALADIGRWRHEISDIVHGVDERRLLVIVGPCSIHDPVSAIDYAKQLVAYRKRYADTIYIVMRVYFEKPRTTVGWKGLINDPHMDGSNDINVGLELARRLLVDITLLGMPVACEFLDVFTPQYLGDLVSWGAIGARTTESQLHRELASGLSPPIGFKNGTDGNVDIAIDAIIAASSPHTFLGIDENGQSSIVRTKGNSCLHIILRGGASGPNYDAISVGLVRSTLQKRGLGRARIMVDCSHGNSNKNYLNQSIAMLSVLRQIINGISGGSNNSGICGLMIESHIKEGSQKHSVANGKVGLEYGKSVTDGCIGLEETARLFEIIWETFGHVRTGIRL